MKLNAYSIFDNKSLIYMPPFFTHTDHAACRMIQDTASDPNSTLGRHPGDYVLYFVGTYDDSNGQLWPEQPLRHVRDVLSLLKPVPDNTLPFPTTTAKEA